MKVNPDTLIKLSYKRVFFLSLVFDLLIFYYNTLYLSCIFRFTKRYDSIRCFLYNPQTKVRQKSFIFRIISINHHIPCCSTSQINLETICTYHRNNICRIIQMKQSSNIVIFLYFSRFVIVTIWTNHIEFIRRMTANSIPFLGNEDLTSIFLLLDITLRSICLDASSNSVSDTTFSSEFK